MGGQDFRVTVNIGDARPGEIVHISEEQLADPWMRGQIAASILVPVDNARVTAPEAAGEETPGLDASAGAQEPLSGDGTAGDDGTPSEDE